jgi:hypothetical protein
VRKEWNGVDEAGHPVRFVRWPIGSSSDLVVLQIPFAYIEFAGGCSIYDPSSSNGECRTPFSSTAPLLQAMLPDLSPVPQRSLSDEEAQRVIHIKIDSVFAGRERTIAETLQSYSAIRLEGFDIDAGLRLGIRPWRQDLLIYKEPRFGLERIGLRHDQPPAEAASLRDFLYLPSRSGDHPDPQTCPEFDWPATWPLSQGKVRICRAWAESSDFLTCTDGAAPNRIPPPTPAALAGGQGACAGPNR